MENERAVIGDNQPEQTPFELIETKTNDIYGEAKNWFDGEEITEEQEPLVDKLLDEIKAVSKLERATHKEDKAPHLEAGRAIDYRHKPLKDKLDKAATAAKQALTPLRHARQAEKEAEEQRLRDKAALATKAAQEAAQGVSGNLDKREEMDAKEDEARKATLAANRLSRAPTGLRTRTKISLVDYKEAMRDVFYNHKEEMELFLCRLAESQYRENKKIAGFEYKKVTNAS